MSALLAVAGVVLILLAMLDVVLTTLSASEGEGPVTGALLRGSWWLMMVVHRRVPGRWLRFVGPLMLLSALLVWFALLWTGWTLVFLAGHDVTSTPTGAAADVWGTAYYTGYSMLTLGVGDFTVDGDAWRILTVVSAFSGLFVMTLSITYLMSVLSAVVQRNALALQISAVGTTAAQVVLAGWDGERFVPGHFQQLADLSAPLARVAEQHLAYGVLSTFHAGHRDTSLPVAVSVLDDAMLVLTRGVTPDARPGYLPESLRAVVARLLRTSSATRGSHAGPPPPPDLAPLHRAGVPLVHEQQFHHAVVETAERRAALHTLVDRSGWTWQP